MSEIESFAPDALPGAVKGRILVIDDERPAPGATKN